MTSISQSQTSAIPGVSLSWRQLAGLAGILGVILFVIGIVLEGSPPTINDSVQEARTWWSDNGQRVLWSQFIISVAVLFFIVPFAVGLRQRLSEAEGATGCWAQTAFVSLILWLVLGGAASIASGALALGVNQIEGDGSVRVLQYLDFAGFSSNSIISVPFFLGLAMVVLRTRVFWGWLAYLSLVLAVLSFIGTFAFVSGDPDSPFMFAGLLSTLGLGVIVLLTGFTMLRDRSQA